MEFSLWVFDKDFLASVAILVFACFASSFLLTRLLFSKSVSNAFSGNTTSGFLKKRNRLMSAMKAEIDALRDGRKDEELDEEEKEDIKATRRFYARKMNEEDE